MKNLRITEGDPIELSDLLVSEIKRVAQMHSEELNKRCLENFKYVVSEIEAHEIEDSINELVGEMTYKEEA